MDLCRTTRRPRNHIFTRKTTLDDPLSLRISPHVTSRPNPRTARDRGRFGPLDPTRVVACSNGEVRRGRDRYCESIGSEEQGCERSFEDARRSNVFQVSLSCATHPNRISTDLLTRRPNQVYPFTKRSNLTTTRCTFGRQTPRPSTMGSHPRYVALISSHLATPLRTHRGLLSLVNAGMTLDLLSHMTLSRSASDLSTYPYALAALDKPLDSKSSPGRPLEQQQQQESQKGLNPFSSSSEASIFPRFVSFSLCFTPLSPSLDKAQFLFLLPFVSFEQSYPDINLLIYLFGWRYRRLLRSNPSSRPPTTPRTPSTSSIPTYRVNWAGMSLNAYYAAVRRALVVAVLMRAIAAIGTVGIGGWWIREWWRGRKGTKLVTA